MLRYYDVKMLRCYAVTMLRSYVLKYPVTMLRPRVDFLYVPNETRPLCHEIMAVFGVPFHTERNEAVYSWDNGRVWSSSSTYRRK